MVFSPWRTFLRCKANRDFRKLKNAQIRGCGGTACLGLGVRSLKGWGYLAPQAVTHARGHPADTDLTSAQERASTVKFEAFDWPGSGELE